MYAEFPNTLYVSGNVMRKLLWLVNSSRERNTPFESTAENDQNCLKKLTMLSIDF